MEISQNTLQYILNKKDVEKAKLKANDPDFYYYLLGRFVDSGKKSLTLNSYSRVYIVNEDKYFVCSKVQNVKTFEFDTDNYLVFHSNNSVELWGGDWREFGIVLRRD